MRTIFVIFSFVFLAGCSVHTITNETNLDFEIKKSGGGTVTLKAQSCVSLDEYFLGLGGDFPFTIRIEGAEDYSKEYSAGHYKITSEVKATSDNETAENTNTSSANNVEFELSLSSKNLSCEKEDEKEDEKEEIDNKMVAVCGDKSAKCESSGIAKCIMKDNKNTPVCVDDKDTILKDTDPACDDKSLKVECKEKSNSNKVAWEKDSQTRVFCLTGQVQCPDSAEIACIKEGDQSSVPACLKDNKKVADADVGCVDSSGNVLPEGKLKCLQPISITLATVIAEQTVRCGTGTPQCADGGKPVCGAIPGDLQDQPYCVNEDNIRWPGSVTCSNDVSPNCGQ